MGNRFTISSLEALRTCLNGPWDASEPVTFLATSQTTLLEGVAEVLRTSVRRCQEDFWWPAPCPPPALSSDPQLTSRFTLPVTPLCSARTPGLCADVKMKWQLPPQLPPLEECPQDVEDFLPSWARVDQQPPMLQRFLLVEFSQFLVCTEEELEQAQQHALAGRSDRYWEIKKPIKQSTLRVGLIGQYEEWSPQDKVLWQALELQKGLRVADRARRNLTLPSPREALVQVLEQALQQKKEHGGPHTVADPVLHDLEETLTALGARPPDWDPWQGTRHPEGLRVVDYVLPQHSERQPLGWLPVWIDPELTPLEDIQWVLVLSLLQEQMIAREEVADFLQRYMRHFTHAMTKDEYDLLPRSLQLAGGGERFDTILNGFAYYEPWKGVRSYITRTLHGLSASAAREAVEQSGPRAGSSPELTAPYAVDDVVRLLQAEAPEGAWTLIPRTLYNWIKAGKISMAHGNGKTLITEEGLEQLRVLVQKQRQQKALKTYYIETGEAKQNKDPVGAARKRMQRHRQRGESPEDITDAIRRGHKA